MSGWGVVDVEQVDVLLAGMEQALDGLAGVRWWRLPETDLLAVTQRVERVARRLQVPQIGAAAEIDARGLADQHAVRSTTALLSNLLTITPTEAAGRVAAAGAILPPDTTPTSGADHPAPVLAYTAAAVGRGELGGDQLRIITTTMRKLSAAVDAETRALCEKTLVEEAHTRPAPKLAVVAEQILAITDPDGTDHETHAPDRAELTIGATRRNGLTPITGLLDPLGIETLRQALEPLAAPTPGGDGVPDPRSAATRRAHALVELARRWLTSGGGPKSQGVRPHATIVCTLDQLRDGVGAALLDYAGTAGAGLTRLLTCDAQTTLLAVDHHGRILDGTGEFRLFSAAQRKALAVRDGGCAFPGCDIPAAWTDAHHIKHWADGGPTVVDNGVLLCGYHHGVVHRHNAGWAISLDPDDRKPWFVPPPWIDPGQQPRRNHLHTLNHIPSRIIATNRQ